MDWNEVFDYVNGILYWKSGKIAGNLHHSGYKRVGYKRKEYLMHRVVYEMFYGPIPKGMEIDHINRIRDDNRIENLRLATSQQNSFNTSSKGYSWGKHANKWIAQIRIEGKKKHLGCFNTKEEAKKAYEDAKKQRDREFI